MSVPCPHCGFLVALIVAEGGPPQRCPRCRAELRGEGAREQGPRQAPVASADESENWRNLSKDSDGASAPASPDTDVQPARSGPGEPVLVATDTVSASVPDSPTSTASTRTARARAKQGTPSFARVAARSRSSGPSWSEILAVSVLGLLLIAQLVLAQRNELAADPRWRPAMGAVCAVLRCDLPAWREPAAYTMLDRNVQPSVGKAGVLSVTASFRNDARWPQPWPTLMLNLSDINGQPVAARAFQASEYRHAEVPGSPAELAPGQSASVEFEIIEPALPVVAFTFDFR